MLTCLKCWMSGKGIALFAGYFVFEVLRLLTWFVQFPSPGFAPSK